MHLVLNRHRILFAALVILGAVVWLVISMQPERRLRRTWGDLLAMTEARRAAAIGDLLAEDYSDRWGHDRASLVENLRMAFHHFDRLELRVSDVTVDRSGTRATIVATIRIQAGGSPRADEARATINGLFAPFTFEWRQAEAFPWAWKLTSVDQPTLNPQRFRAAGYLY